MGFENKVGLRERALGNELPNVPLVYRINLWKLTGETRFKLSFRVEVIVLVDILSEIGRM